MKLQDCKLTPEDEQKLLGPYNHISEDVNEEIAILKTFKHWFDISEEDFEIVSAIVDKTIKGNKLIDHIEASEGEPPFAHELHGPALTINACNYVGALTVRQILGSFKVEKVRIEAVSKFTEQQRNYCKGKQMEIDWVAREKCPSKVEFQRMIQHKRASVIVFGYQLMKLFTSGPTCTRNFEALATLLGLYLQLQEDLSLLNKETDDSDDTKLAPLLSIYYRKQLADFPSKDTVIKRTQGQLDDVFEQIEGEVDRLGGNPLLSLTLMLYSAKLNDANGE